MKKIVLFISFFLFFQVCQAEEIITVSLRKCVDGDTAYFENKNGELIKARFLAIDTPEYTKQKEKYGKEASEFTCKKLKESKNIKLEIGRSS